MLKKDFTDKVYNKLGKTISKLLIEDVISEANKHIKQKIIEDGIFNINNFGIFSVRKSVVRFISNISLIKMIKNKLERENRE